MVFNCPAGAAMYITTTGLVLRETTYKESSKMLTVLTPTEGKIAVLARGARRRGSKTAAGTQFLAYSEMTLFSGRGGWTLTEARSLELFQGLREDVRLLALGAYFAELLDILANEDVPNPEMVSAGLNGLYALSEDRRPEMLVKAAFELRLMCIAGFAPALDGCAVCGREMPGEARFSMTGGTLCCHSCGGADDLGRVVSPGVLAAMRHITCTEVRRLYSFRMEDAPLRQLAALCEAYVQIQMDRGFRTLDFYKSLRTPGDAADVGGRN